MMGGVGRDLGPSGQELFLFDLMITSLEPKGMVRHIKFLVNIL